MSEGHMVVGKRVTRLDAEDKATGNAEYTMDMQLPGLLHCKLLRSPVAHARITGIDTAKASALPGVRAVICYRDVPDVAYNSSYRIPADKAVLPFDERVFEDRVRFIGDRVAAVAAETEKLAEQAVELIEVEYEPLPAIFGAEEAMLPESPRVHDGALNNVAKEFHREIGDVAKGFGEADLVLEATATTPAQYHSCIEPRTSLASMDKRGKLTVWTSNQVPFCIRTVLSHILTMPMSKIRVITPAVGGAFGGKDELFDEHIVSILAQATGRPVKIVYGRREDFISSRVRHPTKVHVKIGVKEDGRITARHLTSIMNTGAYAAAGPRIMSAMGVRWMMLYNTPNMRYDGFCVYTNNIVSGAFRGYGNPQAAFVTETLLDEIADRLDMDPMDLRKKNHVKAGDPNPAIPDHTIHSCGLGECMERGAERIGWKPWREARRQELAGPGEGKKRGLGMAIALHNTSGSPVLPDVSAAIVRMNHDGTATVMTGACEIGQGSDTALAQIAAEVLGLRLDDVELISGDTDKTPFDLGAFASRTTHAAGNAVMLACLDARQQLFEEAAEVLEVKPEDLEAKDRRIRVKGAPDKSVPIAEVVEASQFGEKFRVIIGKASYHVPSMVPPFAAQFAEVEVDTESGQVTVERIVAAHDVGKAINPMAIEGQIEGAVQQGMGYTLMENLQLDAQTGRVLNPNYTDYRLALAPDMPAVETIIVETMEPTGPFGAKGVAEIGMVATAPAIVNAIHDAIGIRFWELPVTAEKVLKAIEAKWRKDTAGISKS